MVEGHTIKQCMYVFVYVYVCVWMSLTLLSDVSGCLFASVSLSSVDVCDCVNFSVCVSVHLSNRKFTREINRDFVGHRSGMS